MSGNALTGWIGIIVAAFGFGSNFLIIKKWSPGDGMFFQLNMCIAVWMTGLVYHIAIGAPPIQAQAMIGGALWATGNLLCPLIIECIGIGLGLLIWGTANMTIGWMSAHFGILGVAQETVSKPHLNVVGFGCAIASILIYALVKPMGSEETAQRKAAKKNKAKSGLGYSIQSGDISKESLKDVLDSPSEISDGRMTGKMSDTKKRLVGCLLAVVAGCLFGTCFNPAQGVSDQSVKQFCGRIVMRNATMYGSTEDFGAPMPGTDTAEDDCNHITINCMSFDNTKYDLSLLNTTTHKRSPQTTKQFCHSLADTKGKVYCQWKEDLNGKNSCTGIPDAHMAFSQFCGILLASFCYFCVYNVYMQGFTSIPGEPFVNKKLIGPGFACGMVWAFAQIGWFYANENLSMQIAFPVITTAPGLIGTIWGIILHDEISLKPMNMFFLALAIAVAGTADALITLSK